MVRGLIAGVVGGIVFYIWGMASWMVLPLHLVAVNTLPDEAAISSALQAQELESGVYIVPWTTDESEWEDPESDWAKRHEAGPIYSIFYRADGGPVMDPGIMVGGLLIDIVAGLIAAWLLCLALPRCQAYLKRVLFIFALGVFVSIIAHLGYWNWMHFSWPWTFGFIVDNLVGWGLAGLAMAAIMKPSADDSDSAEAASA